MLRYIIIIPAYNEEQFLPQTIESVLQQVHLPAQLIIVNDGSTDQTGQLMDTYAAQNSMIAAVHIHEKKGYEGGSKIVKAFYHGFDAIDVDYDFLVKLDADISLPQNYFSTIAQMFADNPKLGLAGGLLMTKKEAEWVYENFSDKDHVKGAYKAWRKQTFEDIGGLKRSIGWDTVDEIMTLYYGWEVEVNDALPVKHFRPLGEKTGFFKVRIKVGYGFYRMRYGLLVSTISAMKSAFRDKPYILSGLGILLGWFIAFFRRDEFMVSKEEGRFIRAFRWKRFREKLGG